MARAFVAHTANTPPDEHLTRITLNGEHVGVQRVYEPFTVTNTTEGRPGDYIAVHQDMSMSVLTHDEVDQAAPKRKHAPTKRTTEPKTPSKPVENKQRQPATVKTTTRKVSKPGKANPAAKRATDKKT